MTERKARPFRRVRHGVSASDEFERTNEALARPKISSSYLSFLRRSNAVSLRDKGNLLLWRSEHLSTAERKVVDLSRNGVAMIGGLPWWTFRRVAETFHAVATSGYLTLAREGEAEWATQRWVKTADGRIQRIWLYQVGLIPDLDAIRQVVPLMDFGTDWIRTAQTQLSYSTLHRAWRDGLIEAQYENGRVCWEPNGVQTLLAEKNAPRVANEGMIRRKNVFLEYPELTHAVLLRAEANGMIETSYGYGDPLSGWWAEFERSKIEALKTRRATLGPPDQNCFYDNVRFVKEGFGSEGMFHALCRKHRNQVSCFGKKVFNNGVRQCNYLPGEVLESLRPRELNATEGTRECIEFFDGRLFIEKNLGSRSMFEKLLQEYPDEVKRLRTVGRQIRSCLPSSVVFKHYANLIPNDGRLFGVTELGSKRYFDFLCSENAGDVREIVTHQTWKRKMLPSSTLYGDLDWRFGFKVDVIDQSEQTTGMSLLELAKKLCLHPTTVYKWPKLCPALERPVSMVDGVACNPDGTLEKGKVVASSDVDALTNLYTDEPPDWIDRTPARIAKRISRSTSFVCYCIKNEFPALGRPLRIESDRGRAFIGGQWFDNLQIVTKDDCLLFVQHFTSIFPCESPTPINDNSEKRDVGAVPVSEPPAYNDSDGRWVLRSKLASDTSHAKLIRADASRSKHRQHDWGVDIKGRVFRHVPTQKRNAHHEVAYLIDSLPYGELERYMEGKRRTSEKRDVGAVPVSEPPAYNDSDGRWVLRSKLASNKSHARSLRIDASRSQHRQHDWGVDTKGRVFRHVPTQKRNAHHEVAYLIDSLPDGELERYMKRYMKRFKALHEALQSAT